MLITPASDYHFSLSFYNPYQSPINHSPLKDLVLKVLLLLLHSSKNLAHKVGKLVLKLEKRLPSSVFHSLTLPLKN